MHSSSCNVHDTLSLVATAYAGNTLADVTVVFITRKITQMYPFDCDSVYSEYCDGVSIMMTARMELERRRCLNQIL